MLPDFLELNELARALKASDSILTSEEGITGVSGINLSVYFEVADNVISVLETKRLVVARLAALYWQHQELQADLIAGVPRGMDTIVSSLADKLDLGQLKVNPDVKANGTKRRVDGIFQPGMRVAVFEDVIVTGGSTLKKCVIPLQEAGLEVVGCFGLIGRPQGGVENIQATGIPTFVYTPDLPLLESAVKQKLFEKEPEKLALIQAEIEKQRTAG
jgi:orotate phosphoribosyltransferase